MKNLTYKMSKEMVRMLLTSKHAGGAGLQPEEVIPYLNKTCGFKGKIVEIKIF